MNVLKFLDLKTIDCFTVTRLILIATADNDIISIPYPEVISYLHLLLEVNVSVFLRLFVLCLCRWQMC